MRRSIALAYALFALLSCRAAAQTTNPVAAALEKDGSVRVAESRAVVSRYSFTRGDRNVEAILFRPEAEGKFPAVLLIPGYQRRALHQIQLGLALAAEGYCCVAVTQPGFGESSGPADYVGPATLSTLNDALDRLLAESFADRGKVGVYGYSRGAMAASLLATMRDDLDAAVFGAGVYDFRRAHDETTIPEIAKNMEAESGWTDEAIAARSSLGRMNNLKCPVLILHGEKDENVPVNQATMLRDELSKLDKPFEIRLYADRDHSIGSDEVRARTIEFFNKHLR